MVSEFELHELTNHETCSGYFPYVMKNKTETELNFLLSRKSPTPPTSPSCNLACSLVVRESSFSRSNSAAAHQQLVEQIRSPSSTRHLNTSKPVIIIFHGHLSWRNQMLLCNLAFKLSDAIDAHVIRFDFTSNGHSPGKWKYFNVEQEYEDLQTILDFVTNSLGCRVACIIGHSQGALAALQTAANAAKDDREGKEVVCKCFVNLCGEYCEDNLFNPETVFPQQYPELKEKGYFYIAQNVFGPRFKVTQNDIERKHAFYSSNKFSSLKKGNDPCDIHVLTMQGSKDEVNSVECAYRYDENFENHTMHVFDGANHNLNGLKHLSKMVSMIESLVKPRI